MSLATDRVIIVGAGLAALTAALRLAPRPVLVISPDRLGTGAASAWAQGGIAAALGPDDAPARHAADTLRAGAGTADPEVARLVASRAAAHIDWLAGLGARFDRDAGGACLLSREAAHSRARIVRVRGDQTGREIMACLIAAVRAAPAIQVAEGVAASALHLDGGRVAGVWLERADRPSQRLRVTAPAVLLASGGAAGLYAATTNPSRIRGQALGMAARAGAVIADAEFVQFHPTAIAVSGDPLPLATEALRGLGAILVNDRGERFMRAVHPAAELAPRDIVARAVYAETLAGRRPMLDTRGAVGAAILTGFPTVATACTGAGIDPVSQAIPVAAAAHYHMGGIATDLAGRSSLAGLWVCGESACTGLHGANRLASNGLLEAMEFARRAAADIAASLSPGPSSQPLHLGFPAGGQTPDSGAVQRLRDLMTCHVGVVRDGPGLRAALDGLARLAVEARGNDGFANMVAAATLIAAAALRRTESRGSHYRSDFPQPDPRQARRSRLTLAEAEALRDERELA